MSYIDLMKYLPQYYQENAEMIEIQRISLGAETYELNSDIPYIYLQGFVSTADASRLAQWERDLGILPADTIEQRRENILSYFKRKGKLNEEVIKKIVAFHYDNADCDISIENSNIKIIIYPTHEEHVNFDKIVVDLYLKKPAHLGVVYERYHCNWGDIKNDFNTWNDVKNNGSWNDVKLHLPYL